MATFNPHIHAFGYQPIGGRTFVEIFGDKHTSRVFSSWISDMGNAQNTCKLIRLATELFRMLPYVKASEGLAASLKTAGDLFEKLRDLPAITYFVDRVTHIVRPDPKKGLAGMDLRDRLSQVKDYSDCAAMGILTVNIFSSIFSSSLGSSLMQRIDHVSLAGDVAEIGKYVIDWKKTSGQSKIAPDSIFYMRMTGAFLSATAGAAKILNDRLKKEIAPEWALKSMSFVGTSLKLYASYSDYSKSDKPKVN
ncbi:MAG: hypothetical protein IT584_00185 [Chlamydiae bacterium]|nr:hypothetical protein [Chlamydiota bacterium]